MSNAYAFERRLDVGPMIDALRFQPSDFEMDKDWLLHVPSRHRFRFDWRGNMTVHARCGCAGVQARDNQAEDLRVAYEQWWIVYWREIETNREFAHHFAPVGRIRRFARDLRMAFRRLRRGEPRSEEAPNPLAIAAE